MSSTAIIPLLQGLFCIRKMNSFSLNAFSTSSYCDISPLQKLSVITCEEGDLYSQGSQLVDPNLIFRWGCKMDLIQSQYSSQTNPILFKKKKTNNISFGNLQVHPVIKLKNVQVFPRCLCCYLILQYSVKFKAINPSYLDHAPF